MNPQYWQELSTASYLIKRAKSTLKANGFDVHKRIEAALDLANAERYINNAEALNS